MTTKGILKTISHTIRKLISAKSIASLQSLLLCVFVLLPLHLDAALTIAVRSTSASERSNFFALEKRFNLEYLQIEIKFIAYRTAQYKPLVSRWLSSSTGPDVLFWHAGEHYNNS